MDTLAPIEKGTYIDGTFGAGGYTKAILNHTPCHVIAIDRDPDAIVRGALLKEEYGERLYLIHGTFGDMERHLRERDLGPIDGIVLDLGVSSPQLDEALRGFSFQKEGPLDMRMSKEGLSAFEVVNTFSEKDLSNILWEYGDESKSRRIARSIVERRKQKDLETTLDLAEAVYQACGRKKPHQKTDPATKTFQAIRIYINDEMGELKKALEAAKEVLAPNGKLVVVTFHSLEDRIVKNFMRNNAGQRPQSSRHAAAFDTVETEAPIFEEFSRKSIKPTEQEISLNPRARSAQLRWARKGGPKP